MNKRVQNLLLFFILFLIIALAGFNFALNRYGTFWEKMKFFQPKEVLIGQDFIGLPEEKILELLSLPENKDKMILPVYPDPETQIRVEPYRDRKGERHMVLIYNSQERVLFNPTNFGVRFEMIIQESRGEMLSSGSFYLKNGFIIAVDNNVPGVEFKMSPGEESEEGLGTILATNIQERQGVRPELGKPLITIFCNLDSVGDNPRDYLLEYKGRIVSLKKNE